MGAIKFVRATDAEFVAAREIVGADPDKLTPGELQCSIRMHHPGGPDGLQLFEAKFPPNITVEPHAHEVDEVIFIADGEIHIGKQKYGVGSSILIPRMTLYTFRSGPEGLRLINFRGRSDHGVITKPEFVARRAQQRATTEGR